VLKSCILFLGALFPCLAKFWHRKYSIFFWVYCFKLIVFWLQCRFDCTIIYLFIMYFLFMPCFICISFLAYVCPCSAVSLATTAAWSALCWGGATGRCVLSFDFPSWRFQFSFLCQTRYANIVPVPTATGVQTSGAFTVTWPAERMGWESGNGNGIGAGIRTTADCAYATCLHNVHAQI